ncbi:MAG: hypothetical protein CMN79_03215 [Spirochaetales bacterium]|nr:hypothetical protein [Spirochaetales bacterium]
MITIKTHKQIGHKPSFYIIPLILFFSACSSNLNQPETRVEEVVDVIHGIEFPDPYRWLEKQYSSETRNWIDRQNNYAEKVVGKSAFRDQIEKRMKQLSLETYNPNSSPPRSAGDYQYFTFRPAGKELPIIFRRPMPTDSLLLGSPIDPTLEYEVVLDPHGKSPKNTLRYSIVDFSDNGDKMIYSQRDGGEDELRIKIRDLNNNSDLPDSLPRSLYGTISFSKKDNGSLYYVKRSREIGPRVMRHKLGTDINDDELIFGEGYGPECFMSVIQADSGRYLIFSINHGWARSELHFQDLETGTKIQTIADNLDARFYTRIHNNTLFIRTNYGADKNRLMSVNLKTPGIKNWQEVISETEHVMENFTFIDEKIYVTYIVNASNQIKVYNNKGKYLDNIAIPSHSSASIRSAQDGYAYLTISSLTNPVTIYKINLDTKKRQTWYKTNSSWDPEGIIVKQIWRNSKDGTKAPMWVMHHKDIKLNGNNPTWLTGYGGFYAGRKPRFNTAAALWVELGGVYSVATLRGGSEFGESWHRDGMLLNKQNVFDDFISAAEWLIENKYTDTKHLGIQGTSNGGLLVGAAMTQRPELFRAVLCGYPDVDILRFPWYTNNSNIPAMREYGSSKILEQFEAIRKYSPYQNVKQNVAYPAVMLMTGDMDTRVPPLAGRKMTAILQASSSSGYPIILRYTPKSGHAAGRGISFTRRIADIAMEFTFMAQQLELGN